MEASGDHHAIAPVTLSNQIPDNKDGGGDDDYDDDGEDNDDDDEKEDDMLNAFVLI